MITKLFLFLASLTLGVVIANRSFAHEIYGEIPQGLFQVKWDWDPTLVFFLIIGVAYSYGLRRFKSRKPVQTWQVCFFYVGLSINAAALLPPIDPLSDRLFFMHMIQHQMITALGVPMMLFGVPFFIVIRGAPLWFRKKIYFPFLRSRILMAPFYILSFPLAALIFYQAMIWLWHIPLFYNLALFNDWFHLLEHGCFALSAMFLWRNIIAPHPLKSRLPLPARLLYLAVIEAANIGLSAWLTFSTKVQYGYDAIPQPSWWTFDHLTDQQLGGLIMWVPGGMINYLAMTVVFFVWVNQEQRKDREKRQKKLLPAVVH